MPDLPVASAWFIREKLSHGITLLSESAVDPFARCNIWHVQGRDSNMFVDTGLGLVSLRESATDLFERPVQAVVTHSHYDHAGGLHEFSTRVAHVSEVDELLEPHGFSGLRAVDLGDELASCLRSAGYALPELLLTALPFDGYDLKSYAVRPAPATRLVDEGDIIDLGDRCFEVLRLPGHSPGSIGLWEPRTGVLFSGDALYDGPLLACLPGSDIHDYLTTLERLERLPAAVVHAGHDGSFGPVRMRELITNARHQLLRDAQVRVS